MATEESNSNEIVVTLLEDETNYISQIFQLEIKNNNFILPHFRFQDANTIHQLKGFAMEYVKRNFFATENTVFVKLCVIDQRLGILNIDHILFIALLYFAFDVIQHNDHIQVWIICSFKFQHFSLETYMDS